MGRLSFGDKDEEEYDNRLIARGKVMATLKSLEVLVILFIYCFIFLLLFFIHFLSLFFLIFFALNLSFTRFCETRISSLVLEGAWKLR